MEAIQPGTVVTFRRGDGTVQIDRVRMPFWQRDVLPPRQPGPAVMLTHHSWCWMSDLADVLLPCAVAFCRACFDPALLAEPPDEHGGRCTGWRYVPGEEDADGASVHDHVVAVHEGRYATAAEAAQTPAIRYGCTGCDRTFADAAQLAAHVSVNLQVAAFKAGYQSAISQIATGEAQDVASCGHPRNEDGEHDCANWPEPAPLEHDYDEGGPDDLNADGSEGVDLDPAEEAEMSQREIDSQGLDQPWWADR
jgi:hypothetical protein